MTKTKPATWTVGTTLKDGFTVARVRQFFAVLKKQDDKGTTWAVELIDGKRLKADSSVDAGVKGRAYRDAQKDKGVTVERTRKATTAKAPAKTPAERTAAKKAPAKRATAKK